MISPDQKFTLNFRMIQTLNVPTVSPFSVCVNFLSVICALQVDAGPATVVRKQRHLLLEHHLQSSWVPPERVVPVHLRRCRPTVGRLRAPTSWRSSAAVSYSKPPTSSSSLPSPSSASFSTGTPRAARVPPPATSGCPSFPASCLSSVSRSVSVPCRG